MSDGLAPRCDDWATARTDSRFETRSTMPERFWQTYRCRYVAKWRLTWRPAYDTPTAPRLVCGVHVRQFRADSRVLRVAAL